MASTDNRDGGEHDPRDQGCKCESCGRRYKVDLMLPDALWYRINAQNGIACNLLCPLCIAMRLENLGEFDYFFLTRAEPSTATASQPDPEKQAQEIVADLNTRLVENCEASLDGASDEWLVSRIASAIRAAPDYQAGVKAAIQVVRGCSVDHSLPGRAIGFKRAVLTALESLLSTVGDQND